MPPQPSRGEKTDPFVVLRNAMASLTASATATAGSLTHFINAPFASLHRAIASVQSQINSFVQFANPAAIIRFKLAWEDLQGVIGRMLLPVLNNITLIIQKMADYLNAATPAAKGFIVALVAVGVIATTVTGAFIGLAGAMLVLKLVMDTATGGITAVAGAIGAAFGLITSAAIGTSGLTLAFSPADVIKQIIAEIGPPLMQVFDLIGSAVLSFTTGVLPGVISAVTAVADAMRVVLGSFGSDGKLFETIGKSIAVVIQIIALHIQILAHGFRALVDVMSALGKILFGNINLIGTLSIGFDRILAILKAVSMVIAGEREKPQEPGRAPPAVRQAQSGSIQSFITRAYVSAFSAGGGDPAQSRHNQMMDRMKIISDDAANISADIKSFLSYASQMGNEAAKTVANIPSTVGRAAAEPVMGPARMLMSMVTGK